MREGPEIDIGDPSSPGLELLFTCNQKYPIVITKSNPKFTTLQYLIMLQVDRVAFVLSRFIIREIKHLYFLTV